MKKLFMGILLPLFAFVSLVGAGFSTWYFERQLSADGEHELTVRVEDYAKIGKFTITGGNVLSLDQATTNNIPSSGPGVRIGTVSKEEPDDVFAAKNININYTHDANYPIPEGDTFKLTVTITVDANLAKYIQLSTTTIDDVECTTSVNTYTFDFSSKAKGAAYDVVIPANAFTYKKGMEPTVYEITEEDPEGTIAYKDMVSEVSSSNITIAVRAEITKA